MTYMLTNSLSLICVPFSWLEASVLPDPLASAVLLSARGGLVKSRANERMVKKMHVTRISVVAVQHFLNSSKRSAEGVPECSDGGEVVVDVKHGSIQQCVDVLKALQSGLQPTTAFLLQLPQFFL